MHTPGPRLGRAFTPLLVLILIMVGQGASGQAAQSRIGSGTAAKSRIMVLHSYHQGYRWTDSISEGLSLALADREDIELGFYYLDSQRLPLARQAAALETFIAEEISFGGKPLALLCVDDDAFRFALDRRDGLFSGIELLYCGINFRAAYSEQELSAARGILESPDIRANLELIQSLFPAIENIAVISDASTTGRLNKRIFDREILQNGPLPAIIELTELEPEALQRALKALPERSIIVYLSYLLTPERRRLSVEQSLRIISEASAAPIMACWDFIIEAGALGGRVVSGRLMGEGAAALIRVLVDGEGPDRGSFYAPSIYEHLFHYEKLRQAGISVTALPKGSLVLGQPPPLPMSAILGILALAFIVILEGLTLALFVRSRRRLKEAEFNYRILSEHIPTVVYMVELGQPNRRSYISPKLKELFGWDEALWLHDQEGWNELIHPEDRERVLAAFEDADRKETPGGLEYRLKTPGASFIWVRSSWDYFLSPSGKRLALGIMSDINLAKERESALQKLVGERELLLREVHHRVKNNLQIVSSLLRLESGGMDPQRAEARALEDAERRVYAMALVHELLYLQDLFGAVELRAYIERLALAIFDQEDDELSIELPGEELVIPLDTAIPLGLICNEALVNIVKHAFPSGFEGKKTVRIGMRNDAGCATISIADNGIGLESRDRVRGLKETPSIGMTLIDVLSQQIKGSYSLEGQPDGGTVLNLRFPLPAEAR
jgi:PAS domain S-box-containing protein